jgi:hypothetical protein
MKSISPFNMWHSRTWGATPSGLERAQIVLGLAAQRDEREHHDAVAERRRIQLRMIAFDDPACSSARTRPQAGRGGQPSAGRQIDIGDAAFVLQRRQNRAVDRIEGNLVLIALL